MSGWADFDNASWGSGSAAFPPSGGGGATAASQTPPRPSSRTHTNMPPMEGIGSAHNVVGSSTPPRHSHHHSSSKGKSSLGSKLASFKRSYGQPQYDDDDYDDDGMSSVVSGTSAISSMSVGTRLQRKIGKMRGLGGSSSNNDGNGNGGGRTPGRNAAGSSSSSGSGGFSSGGGHGDFADFGSAAFDVDFGSAAFDDPPLQQQQLQDAHSVGGGSSFGDANSLASSGTDGTGGGDPFAIVGTPERKRFGFTPTSASASAQSPGSAARNQHRSGGTASGDGGAGRSYGDGTISSSPRMSKFSFLRNSSRRNHTANRMATAPGMPTTTATTTPGGSVNANAVSASPTPSNAGGGGGSGGGANTNANTSDMSRRARTKSRESMKRTWEHSRRLAAMAATPGADGKRPDLGVAPYSPASAYAMTPGGGVGGGSGAGSRTPQTPQTPQVQLQDTWTPNWGEASSSSATGAAAASASAAASNQDIISQGVAALASGAVNGFDPYGLAAGTTSTAATNKNKTEATSVAAPASGGRDSNSTPRHSNLQQQQPQQQSNLADDPFAFDVAFDDNDASTAGGDGFSTSSGWGHHPQQQQQRTQASTPTRQQQTAGRSTAVDDGGRSTKSPHTHRMAAAPSPSRQQQYQQQERYPDRPTRGGLDRFIEQQQRQDHESSAGASSSGGSLLAKSQGSLRNSSVAGSRGADDDTASIISGTSAYSNATGTSSANAAAARRKMRRSMQQARSATGRSQTILSEGDDGTATTAQSTATPRDRAGSGGPSASGRPPISPAPAKTAFADDHSAGGHSAGSDDFNSFDAFGLNAKDIDKEVGAALNDLVASNPDLGFFLDRNRSMSQSSAGGASGSVRSSVGGASVGSSIEADQQQSRGNQFKEASMANSHVRRNVRSGPGQASNGNSPIPPRHTGGSVQDRLNGLQSPDLDHNTPATNNNSKYAGRNPADRLRKYNQRRKQQHPSAVSDVGASTSRSEPEFNAVLNKMKRNRGLGSEKDSFDSSSHADEESRQGSQQEPQHLANLKPVPKDSSRDVMSDFGGTSSSHLFLDSVKLRKTGARLGTNDEATAETARETPSTFNTEATDGSQGFFEGDRRFGGEDHPSQRSEPVVSPSSGPAPQKNMTYRERREIKLQEQAELERQRAAMKEAQKEPQVDVAELVRRRVAANRQMDAFPRDNTTEDQPVSPDDALKDMRSRLKSSRNGGVISPQSAAVGSSPSDNALADVRSRLKKVSVTDSSPSPAASSIPQFSPSIRAAADASPSIKAEVEAEAQARSEMRPQVSVAALMSQRAKVMAEPEPEPEAESERPHISVAALMAQRSKMAGGPPERLGRASPTPSDDPSPMISDEGKNKLSALFASRSALMPGMKPPSADDNGAKEVLKKTNKSKSVASAASVASLIGKRAAKSMKGESGAEATNAGGGSSGASAPSCDGRPALKDDPKYAKYFKMLKMGLPMPAVKHAMTRDGLDPDVMDGDHSKPAGGSSVPLKEDPTYAKYFKMVCCLLVDVQIHRLSQNIFYLILSAHALCSFSHANFFLHVCFLLQLKMGLPMDAVKHAMVRDGLDESVMDGDHNAPAPLESVVTTKSRTRGLKKDTHRRTRLHWGAMDEVNSNSVWALVDGDRDVEGLDIDEEEFALLFQEEIVKGAPKKGDGGGSGDQKDAVKVIDPKRANNGGIILARLKMSYDEMAKVVDTIDETAMSAEQMQGILEYIPTSAERKALRKYMTSSRDAASKFASLCECEKFMVAMMTVKHSKAKIKALLFKSQFHACLEDLAKDAVVVEQACEELKNSIRFRKLLGIVLNLGNRLNTAGSSKKSKARGVSLESLLKLSQAKAFDKKTTFLHYVVLVVQRNNNDLLHFKEDIPNVMKADKVHWDQCLSDLEEVEHQLETVRKIALFEARDTLSSKTRKKMKKAAGDEDEENLPDVEISLEEEVAALRATQVGLFTLDAIKKVSALRDKVEWTNKRFGRLCEYLGEDSNKNTMPHEVFKIMITFCRDFDRAVSDVAKKQKAKQRAQRKDQEKQQAVQEQREGRAANVSGHASNPRSARDAGVPGEQSRTMQKNASVLEKAKLQNPLGMASVLDEIQKKKGSGQDLLRKTPVPSRPPSGQENTQENTISQPHNAYAREAPAAATLRRAAPQDYGPPSRAVASPQRHQQFPQPNYVARSPNVDPRATEPIVSTSSARNPTAESAYSNMPTSQHNGTAKSASASMRNHALRDKVRQRRQRRMASSPRGDADLTQDGTVDWPFPRKEPPLEP